MPIIVSEHASEPDLEHPWQVSSSRPSMALCGTTYYYSTSATGGSVLDHVTYDSFGNIATQTNPHLCRPVLVRRDGIRLGRGGATERRREGVRGVEEEMEGEGR